VLVVAVEAAQAVGPADGNEPADVGPGELVEPDLPENGPDVESDRLSSPRYVVARFVFSASASQ
jgi:hypothetical protein